MNIEIGEYVRSSEGIIAKCIEEKQDRCIFDRIVLGQGYYNDYIFKDIPERANYITKHSKNIIELIEVGDIIDYLSSNLGRNVKIEVDCINTKEEDYKWERGFVTTTLDEHIFIEDIKSIVTKEQFSNMEYRV